MLVILPISGQNGPPAAVLWPVSLLSLGCCFTSSFMLFRRQTGWAITCGLLLFLFNGAIAFFAGCVALMRGMNFF